MVSSRLLRCQISTITTRFPQKSRDAQGCWCEPKHPSQSRRSRWAASHGRGSVNLMRRSVVIFLVTAFLVCPGRVRSQPLISVLVPAYANPCCSGGPAMWSSLLASAADPQRHFELSVIFNPASGPGVGRDPNFLDGAGHGPLAGFRAVGGIAHGYVATGNATRSIVDAKADIDAYLTGQYAGFIDGIFFDEMSNNLADVSYYRELQRYVHTLKPGAQTFGNPGTPFVTNPSGQTAFLAADYIGSLDTIVAFENSGSDYLNAYTSFPFLEGLEPRKLAHILHSQATWNAACCVHVVPLRTKT